MTESSYASTATPPKLEDDNLGLSMGGDFSDMFSGFGKRASAILRVQPETAAPKEAVGKVAVRVAEFEANPKQESFLPGPPPRVYTSNRPPPPIHVDMNREVESAPYSLNSQHSQDRLIQTSTPPPTAPYHRGAPPVPSHGAYQPYQAKDEDQTFSRPKRPAVRTDSGLRRSAGPSSRKQSVIESADDTDEDAKLLRESVLASRHLAEPEQPRVRDSWAAPPSYPHEGGSTSSWSNGSLQTTPRANGKESAIRTDELFDQQIMASADLAQRFSEQEHSPARRPPQNKVMTAAQFERYRQDQDRLRSLGARDDDSDEETYEDEEDEIEKSKQIAKQRRKQEAHMSVYRQQMMKVTGETLSSQNLRPDSNIGHRNATGNSASEGEGEDEDEDVPLAILAAHNFPNKNKAPIRNASSNPNLRASAIGQQPGSGPGGRLPVFARHLPQDPYLGAGLVHPSDRQSLAFGAGAGSNRASSVQGDYSRAPIPGGLVGVIANEERSRALRRGSPATFAQQAGGGGFPSMPPGMPPQFPGPGGMMNGMGPNGPMFAPGDQGQAQMAQQMQEFMQMQMQFMQMMTNGQGPSPNGMAPQQQGGMLQMPFHDQNQRPSSAHQRSMTMQDPNVSGWLQPSGGMNSPSIHPQGGHRYTPSIAPSERSNIGLPPRYRPVSQMPGAGADKSRASTMSGALGNWDKAPGVTVRTVKKSDTASDEDDDAGWAQMKAKRETKKSGWRTKKDNSELKEMLGYT